MPCLRRCVLWLVPVCNLWPIMVKARHWYETKSSNEGQIIEALCGRNPLHKTKSSNEGQIIETLGGQSPLHVTKSSDEGHITETPDGQS
jgi:hypothetical protein